MSRTGAFFLMTISMALPAAHPQDPAAGRAAESRPTETRRTETDAAESRPAPKRLPSRRHGHRMHRIGDELIVFGGFSDSSSDDTRGTRETWIQDLRTGRWSKAADMPIGRAFFGSVVVGDRIHAVAESIDRFDRAADRWETVSPASIFPRSHFGAAGVGTRIYALGGFPCTAGGFVGYDLDRREVVDPPEPPDFRSGDHFHVLVTLGGEIHAVGGLDSEPFVPTKRHWIFNGQSWRPGTPPPSAVWAKFSAYEVAGDALFIFGEDDALRYDLASDRWSKVAQQKTLLVMPSTVSWSGKIFLLGGFAEDRKDRALAYDIGSDRWSTIE